MVVPAAVHEQEPLQELEPAKGVVCGVCRLHALGARDAHANVSRADHVDLQKSTGERKRRRDAEALVRSIALTSFAPSPMASVRLDGTPLRMSSTTRAFWSGRARQQMTAAELTATYKRYARALGCLSA